MAGPGLAYVVWLGHSGSGLFGHALGPSLLMSLVGPVTVAPLALFAWSAQRLPFGVLGFLQFISPTVGLVIGVWAGEPMTPLRLTAFGFIWAALAVFAVGLWRASRRAHLAPPAGRPRSHTPDYGRQAARGSGRPPRSAAGRGSRRSVRPTGGS
jgi:EamA domain-containing membrane protein RarD